MKVAVPKETAPGERRVALTPEVVKRLTGKQFSVSIESQAGDGAGASDAEYAAAGAQIVPGADFDALYRDAALVVKIQPPSPEEVQRLHAGSAIVSLLYPLSAGGAQIASALSQRGVTVLAADRIPRTTLAQMMDVLSSQATVAGYRAALLAAEASPRLFPMLMTAAGTIAPAKVLVLGAGVAGLQAIATARRLGAVVEAFDVRRVVKEQVESLGARFVEVAGADAQTAGGYARELSEEEKQRQAEVLARHVAKSDACICTAQIPGRRAPVLIQKEMVAAMRPGSVIVDAAADQGGNCALTVPGQRITTERGVTIVGERNLPSQMAIVASAMYARNMEKLLLHITKNGALTLDEKEEIARGLTVAKGGSIVDEAVAAALTAA